MSDGSHKTNKAGSGSFLNLSCGATVFMALYVGLAAFNLYQLMYPLASINLDSYPESSLVKPLWSKASTELNLRVYLSSRKQFGRAFLEAEFPEPDTEAPTDVALLWDEKIDAPALSQSILLTTLSCPDDDTGTDDRETKCSEQHQQTDASYAAAVSLLQHAEQWASNDNGSVLSAMSAASGQGIESTSFLLTLYNSMSHQIRRLLVALSILQSAEDTTGSTADKNSSHRHRKIIHIAPDSILWSRLQSNETLYIHALVLRTDGLNNARVPLTWPPTTADQAGAAIQYASQHHSVLLGQVDMIKYNLPHHIHKPKRILAHDLVYLWNRYLLQQQHAHAPWEFVHSKPEEYASYQRQLQLKEAGAGYPYWKPEVAIKLVNEVDFYPKPLAGMSGMPIVQLGRSSSQLLREHPTGLAFTPALHVDEIGMTSEKYIPVNETLTSLPLRLSFDRSDIQHTTTVAQPQYKHTATAGGMSPARWRLLTQLSAALESQTKLGFEATDIDDVRRLIADTNVSLLAFTLLFSALHMLFEFLTFKSEVTFWRNCQDLTGLSVRSLFLDMMGQVVILCFLIERESSLLMTIPCGIGCLIALWKCRRAAGLQFVPIPKNTRVAWWNWIPSLVGYELRATRLELAAASHADPSSSTASGSKKDPPKSNTRLDLARITMEADRTATRTLGSVLAPLVAGYTLYSFFREEHSGWYSWLVTSASSAVYALGFVLMTPQLFLNWKLKSVAHLPWRVLAYKSLNTFIDDLFSFIIRMPTMARISCFRDDIVFFIYLYQRWLYPVDKSRPVEGVGETTVTDKDDNAAIAEKKRQ